VNCAAIPRDPIWNGLVRENKIDLLITGTHGQGQLKKMLLGSVAEEVFRQADCAVLTVGPQVKSEAPQAYTSIYY
jgi:nucleotide-binding universal stress UspA family protein